MRGSVAPMASRTSSPARDLALIATFAALIGAFGLTPPLALPGNAVPITLQTLAVMLCGLILGARRGTAAVLVFLALVAAGMPLLPGGRGGLGVFGGVTAGYLLGWVFGVYVIGLLVQLRRWSWWWGAIATLIGGVGVIYLFGVPVQAARMGTQDVWQTAAAAVVFLPGDLLKVGIATALASAVYAGYPVITPARTRRRELQGSSDAR